MVESQVRQLCGECPYFDKNTVGKQPFGEINTPEGRVLTGVCRFEKGLQFGVRPITSKCCHPLRK